MSDGGYRPKNPRDPGKPPNSPSPVQPAVDPDRMDEYGFRQCFGGTIVLEDGEAYTVRVSVERRDRELDVMRHLRTPVPAMKFSIGIQQPGDKLKGVLSE